MDLASIYKSVGQMYEQVEVKQICQVDLTKQELLNHLLIMRCQRVAEGKHKFKAPIQKYKNNINILMMRNVNKNIGTMLVIVVEPFNNTGEIIIMTISDFQNKY